MADPDTSHKSPLLSENNLPHNNKKISDNVPTEEDGKKEAQTETPQINSGFEANLQSELDKMEAELQSHTGKQVSGEVGKNRTALDYLESNLNYLDKLNDEELDRHLQKIIVGDTEDVLRHGETESHEKDDPHSDAGSAEIEETLEKQADENETHFPRIAKETSNEITSERITSSTKTSGNPTFAESTGKETVKTMEKGRETKNSPATSDQKASDETEVGSSAKEDNQDGEEDKDEIDKELEMFQRVQEEMQEENREASKQKSSVSPKVQDKNIGIGENEHIKIESTDKLDSPKKPLDKSELPSVTEDKQDKLQQKDDILSSEKTTHKDIGENSEDRSIDISTDDTKKLDKSEASLENIDSRLIENDKKVNEIDEPKILDAGSDSTTTYKGVSIPADSELVKMRESKVLKAYKELLEDSQNMPTPSEILNAQMAALPLAITAPEHLSFNVQMLVNTLPTLDNLATQILRVIARESFQNVMELVSNRESYSGIAFGNLVELFETTKRVYNSEENPFFTVENVTFGLWKYREHAPSFLHGKEETIEGTLRKVNLATFLLATLGLIDLGFYFLNEAFLDVFCPPQNLDPEKSISYYGQSNSLEQALPSSVTRHRSAHNQTKFLKSQAILYLELKTQAFISAIELGDRKKDEIIQDLFPNNLDEILLKRRDPNFDPLKKKISRDSTFFTPAELDFLSRCESRKKNLLEVEDDSMLMQKYEWVKFLNDMLNYVAKNVGFLVWGPKGKFSGLLTKRTVLMREQRNRETGSNALPEPKRKRLLDQRENDEMAARINAAASKRRKIRQRQNRPTTFRRTWTHEEEEALKEGLKMKGTHWTAILELFGPGGSINEALKNRTSLQLKDKARNWKLYCLKNNIEVPDYLVKASGGTEHLKSSSSLNEMSVSTIHRPKIGERTPSMQALNESSSKGSNSASMHSLTTGNLKTGTSLDFKTKSATANYSTATSQPNDKLDTSDDITDEFKNLVAQAFD